MNINNQAISTYSGYNFNSIADFNGVILGATATGIRVLGDSANDGGAAIASNFKTGSMDFGDSFMKYLREIWLAFRAGGVLKFTFSVDEDATTEVEKSTTLTGSEIAEERLKVPRGLRGRFFTIEGENVAGVDFDIDSLSMLVEAIKRKIR